MSKVPQLSARIFGIGPDDDNIKMLHAIINNFHLKTPREFDITSSLPSMKFLFDYNRSIYRSDTESSSKDKSWNLDVSSRKSEEAKQKSNFVSPMLKKKSNSTIGAQPNTPRQLKHSNSPTAGIPKKTVTQLNKTKKIYVHTRNFSVAGSNPQDEYGMSIKLDKIKRGSIDSSDPASPRFVIRNVQNQPSVRANSPELMLEIEQAQKFFETSAMSENSREISIHSIDSSKMQKFTFDEVSKTKLSSSKSLSQLKTTEEELNLDTKPTVSQVENADPNKEVSSQSKEENITQQEGTVSIKLNLPKVNLMKKKPLIQVFAANLKNSIVQRTDTNDKVQTELLPPNEVKNQTTTQDDCKIDTTTKINEQQQEQPSISLTVKETDKATDIELEKTEQIIKKKLDGKIKFNFFKKKKVKINNETANKKKRNSSVSSDSEGSLNCREDNFPNLFDQKLLKRSDLYVKECESSISKFQKKLDELQASQEWGSVPSLHNGLSAFLQRFDTETDDPSIHDPSGSRKFERGETNVSNRSGRGSPTNKIARVFEQKEYTARNNNMFVISVIPPEDDNHENNSQCSDDNVPSRTEEESHAQKIEFRFYNKSSGQANQAVDTLNEIEQLIAEEANPAHTYFEEISKIQSKHQDWVQELYYLHEDIAAEHFLKYFDMLLRKRYQSSKKTPEEERLAQYESHILSENLKDKDCSRFIYTPKLERTVTSALEFSNDDNLILEMLIMISENLPILIENYNSNSDVIQNDDLSLETVNVLKFANGAFVEPYTSEIVPFMMQAGRSAVIKISNLEHNMKMEILSLESVEGLSKTLNIMPNVHFDFYGIGAQLMPQVARMKRSSDEFLHEVPIILSGGANENLEFIAGSIAFENKRLLAGKFEDRVRLNEKLQKTLLVDVNFLLNNSFEKLCKKSDPSVPTLTELHSRKESKRKKTDSRLNSIKELSPASNLKRSLGPESNAASNGLIIPKLVSGSSAKLLKAEEEKAGGSRGRAFTSEGKKGVSPISRSDTKMFASGAFTAEVQRHLGNFIEALSKFR